MDLITQLTQEHQNYVLELSTLAAAVIEGIRVNGRGDHFLGALDKRLKPLTVEWDDPARRGEDFLVPRLLERAPDSPAPAMIEEHVEIREKSAAFGRWYPPWPEGDESAYQLWVGFLPVARWWSWLKIPISFSCRNRRQL